MNVTQIALIVATLAQLGALAGVYVKIEVALAEIKTTLAIAEKSKTDRAAQRRLETNAAIRSYCLTECPHRQMHGGTNPRIQAYDGEILP